MQRRHYGPHLTLLWSSHVVVVVIDSLKTLPVDIIFSRKVFFDGIQPAFSDSQWVKVGWECPTQSFEKQKLHFWSPASVTVLCRPAVHRFYGLTSNRNIGFGFSITDQIFENGKEGEEKVIWDFWVRATRWKWNRVGWSWTCLQIRLFRSLPSTPYDR